MKKGKLSAPVKLKKKGPGGEDWLMTENSLGERIWLKLTGMFLT